MGRFEETVNIQPVRAVTQQPGLASVSLSLADRLEGFKSMTLGIAEQRASKRGQETAAAVKLEKEQGVTKAPEFQEERFIGRIESIAHNKALRAGYIASLDSDIKTNIARIQNENPDDIIAFNESIEGFRKGVLQSADPTVRQSVGIAMDERISNSRLKVQDATIAKQREDAKQTLLINEKDIFDDAVLAARNGDLRQSALSLTDYFTNIDAQVEAGFITASAGEEKKRTVELESANQNLIGQIRTKTDQGDFQGVLKDLERLRSKVTAGRSVEEHENLLKGLTAEVTESLNIRNKIESLEDEEIKVEQINNFTTRFKGIVEPGSGLSTSVADITRDLANGNLTETQATQLTNTLNNRGQGVDNFSLINTINSLIRSNEDPDTIKNAIINNAGTQLTEKTALTLMSNVDEMVSGESVLFTNKAKRAKDFIRKKFGLTGPLAQLDFDKSKRLADAERRFDERVLDDEDPFTVADQLIGKEEFNIAPDPRFGTKDDLPAALDNLNQQFDAENIDDDTYNFEVEKINRLKELKENIKLFDQAKKEAENGQ